MTEKLKKILKNISSEKSENNKKIAIALLENNHLNRVSKIAEFCNVSFSSVDRFVKKMGYPSFKHFAHDYQNKEDFQAKNFNNFDYQYKKQGQEIVKQIQGKLFIATSRRDKCIGKFLNERLNDGGVEHEYFRETQNSIKQFVQKCINEKGTLLLISFFSYSRLFNIFLKQIAIEKNKPNVVIITNAKWIDVFAKYKYVSIGQINNKNYDIEKFDEYNYFLSDIFPLFFEILSQIWNKQIN